MMKRIRIMAGVACMIFIAGCAPVYYVPNTQNVPLLTHAKEYNISGTGNMGMLELQTSISPVNHLGIQLNGTWFTPQHLDNHDRGTGYMVDAGVGYYKSFGFDHKFVFEMYGIGGIGGLYNSFVYRDSLTPGGQIYSNMTRYGIQPVIGFKSRYIDVAFSSRFVGLSYFNISGNLVFDGVNQNRYIYDHQHSFLVEPAFTFRAGEDFIKFQFQVLGSINTLYPDFYQIPTMITIGLILSPNRYFHIFKKYPKVK